ncbi:MAG: hypothetical protein HC783_00505 [Rhodobacteraceae bacterium]|nr:hypothetical protein [Paracoccaceae bacterium]
MRTLILSLFLAIPAAADTTSVVTQHIRPGFAAFAAQAKALAEVENCDPAQLRPAFHATYDAWLAVAHMPLGPAEDEGRSLAILFWPDPKALGQKAQRTLLTGDPEALTPDNMAQQSVAARGLAGLERLLYPVEALPADPCPLIHATADDLARMAADLTRNGGLSVTFS